MNRVLLVASCLFLGGLGAGRVPRSRTGKTKKETVA